MNLIELVLILAPLLVFNAYAEDLPDYYNPYAPIFTDKEVYTWTDKIGITIVAPSWDANKYGIDSIGTQEGHLIKISSADITLEPYKLTETETSSGIFTGEVTLTGFLHDVDGDGRPDTNPMTSGSGPTNGFLETQRDGGITISFEFADGVVLTKSVKVSWNVGEIRFMKSDYSIDETAIIQVIDLDMNLNPEGIDQIEVNISSDSDAAGILVKAIETSENLEISSESKFVSNIPPIERISIVNSFIADSSGNLISAPTRNEQLQIAGTVHNNQNYEQNFVFIIQIKESEGAVVSLSWIEGQMSANQNFEVSQSWNPVKAGNYTVETFVWTSLSESIPLSPILRQSYFIQ